MITTFACSFVVRIDVQGAAPSWTLPPCLWPTMRPVARLAEPLCWPPDLGTPPGPEGTPSGKGARLLAALGAQGQAPLDGATGGHRLTGCRAAKKQ